MPAKQGFESDAAVSEQGHGALHIADRSRQGRNAKAL